MTIFDTPLSVSTTPTPHRASLVDRLTGGEPYAIVLGGQGADWLRPLADLVGDFALAAELDGLLGSARELLAPVADELTRTGRAFEPLAWADVLAAAHSAEDDEAPAVPDADALTAPAVSVPGIALTQLAGLRALARQGLDPRTHAPVAVAAHSQGRLVAPVLDGADEAEVLAVAVLAGAALEVVARRRGLLGRTMLSVSQAVPERVREVVDALPASLRLAVRLRNGRRSVVVCGPEASLRVVEQRLAEVAAADKEARDKKRTGGAPFAPVVEAVATRAAFHHPELEDAVTLVAGWAATCGLDGDAAAERVRAALVDGMDWVDELDGLVAAGARWLVDVGPADVATRLSVREVRGLGVGLVAPATRAGHRELVSPGAARKVAPAWEAYAPSVVTLPDGRTYAETRFSRLTGKSPVLLAGMTPTTVDAPIVAAAANAGYWAELAGGGQVTEEIFAARMAELGRLLEPGATFQLNAMFLDPYLWKLHVGGKRLVQRARAAGSALDGLVISAGVPEPEEAAAIVADLRDAGLSHVAFKPGTVAQVRQVLAIAKQVAPLPVIVHVEGGKAGGHHSWEDLDELLLATYSELRAHENVVVCVGGGIGTPEVAADYLTGTWARRHGFPAMPLDGVLVGTAAMATLEATTSPDVKRALVAAPGTPDWIGAGQASGGVASGRSQLGADIHEIDNAASRCGRLLDEVAGDADAVAARRAEIVAALDATAKPYFGDAAQMTYAAWLERFLELGRDASGGWLDVSLRDRFHAMLQRAEARLHEADHGQVPTLFPATDDVEDGRAALATLGAAYPAAVEVVLHPADVPFFVDVCRRPGKPVPFVPVVDADVRRWWRSDSLWQAHDPRFTADQVCIIPGPVAVAGITRADEPVAELLGRFEAATVDAVLAAGGAPQRVPGRRRVNSGSEGALSLALAAQDVVWAGRTVRNPVHRLGESWLVVDATRAEHAETGAVLTADGDVATLDVPLGGTRRVSVPIHVGPSVARGAAPVVGTADAATAMRGLLAGAAGGSLAPAGDGRAVLATALDPDLVADHAGVTAASADGRVPRHAVPDVVVGLSWPAVFAVLGEARTADGTPVVEGMLDLVHLDHQVALEDVLPTERTEVTVTALLGGVADTEYGRVVTVDVEVAAASGRLATLRERFAVRGRTGEAGLADPAPAGATLGDVRDTPRRSRVRTTFAAPQDLRAFAQVSGDHNPIHTSTAAARLAGLGEPIVHGMWLSAAAQQALAADGRRVTGWTTRFMSPLRLGATVELRADRTGLDAGAEVLDVTCRVDGEVVMAATAKVAAPRTAYAFPGQGIQHPGMGMAAYQRSRAAREIWDRADAHTRTALGFSILTVVRDNPTLLVADGVTHKHPDGVLYLTQFTQVAMAVLGAAQMAELREAGAFVDGALLAGHSVGEYNALAAVSGVIPLEAVVEVVFQRGSVMHTLVPRDAEGRSDYRLAAIRPSQIGLTDADVTAYVEGVAERTGEFLQIVNYNLAGSQYAVAGTVAGLEALEADVAERRARFGGKAAFILVPGVDVPFHSTVLRGGVPDFRHRLEELLPADVDPDLLVGRYVPNLVPRLFTLDRSYVEEVAALVPSEPLDEVLADWDAWAARPHALCRRLLIELLAWQFASPVRWIETQALLFGDEAEGGAGVERFVEVGVGGSPTVANLAAQTLKLPGRIGPDVQVLNVERDAAVVFGTDEEPVEVEDDADEPTPAETAAAPATTPAAPAPAPSGGPRPADLSFDAADATRALIAWWTKVRPDQVGAADSIESLTDGVSSRRNQLLVDLGGELGLGAIDGAADADMTALAATVKGLARGYKPFGPVLTTTFADHLKKVLGPTGRKQSAIAERVADVWQLGPGWVSHVVAETALSTREGASVRGGDFGASAPASAAEVDALVDAAVQAVAARHGVAVDLPASGGGEGATVDAAALGAFTETITGPDGVLAAAARVVLDRLGLAGDPAPAGADDDADAAVLARVEAELGSDWPRLVAPAFDAQQAFVLDDRWASAREDLARLAAGEEVTGRFEGTGEAVAAQARWWAERVDPALRPAFECAAGRALDGTPGEWAGELAVVTGASRGSIAASVVGRLLAGGATVVATTSSVDAGKLGFYKQLFRDHARGGAALWVVPANMASFADVDAFASWLTSEQTRTVRGATEVVKPALTPTLLLPFAAGRVAGDLTEAGSRAEVEMRVLLWSVERLVGALSGGRDHDLASRLHVVLPGSPNRGTFGGDGAYGEAKAALDAVVNKWHAEKGWAERVTLAHAVIGWVRGTGLMGGNDPLVEAVEAAGVRTWAPDEMAAELLGLCTPEARARAASAPLHGDLTGGLADADVDLAALAAQVERPSATEHATEPTIAALAPSPAQTAALAPEIDWADVPAAPEDLVVVVGAGELGPYGSARTRFEMEVHDELSAAGVLELAWTTGLVRYEAPGGWYDVASGEPVDEAEIFERYHDAVVEACGIRRYVDEGTMVDNTAPLLTSVYLEQDLTFTVSSEAEARAMAAADPERTRVAPAADGEWTVTRLAGTQVRVPRRMSLSRTVGGQVPTGFDPAAWGVPAEMVESIDRVAAWNLVCTVDAFLSSGFTPAELMRWVHPTRVANTQGTGMGGMQSMQSLYLDTLLGEAKQNDILQEALPNVVAAHVVQAYVGSYGSMIHPVAACATTAVSIEEGVDKIRVGKADVVVAGGFDDLSVEGIVGFADMSATADSGAMAAKGLEPRYFSRANDRRHGGFVESQGGGTILLARGDVAAAMGLPVLAVVAYAGSFADGVHTSIPAPGLGALGAALGGERSPLARSLAQVGLTADDVAVVSKHDTSTGVNELNESDLHERLAAAIGRSAGNPLYVISQKTLTGHAKGGAAAFQTIGLCQVLATGVVPPNRSLDCVMPELDEHEHLVWLREPLAAAEPLKAGLVTSLGFGHVAGLIALAHPQAFLASLTDEDRASYRRRAQARAVEGRMRLARAMLGQAALYERPDGRRLGTSGVKGREASLLLDPDARLGDDDVYAGPACR